MPNLHKSIGVICEKMEAMGKKELEEKMTLVLTSFLQQTKYGIPMLEAFENSILNPSTKKDEAKELEIAMQEKKVANKKYAALIRYKKDIIALRESGNSLRKIAKFLNSFRLKGMTVSHFYVKKFLEEFEIQKGEKKKKVEPENIENEKKVAEEKI